MMSWIYEPEAWVLLATLTSVEIVLGIDNIVVITILVGRLEAHRRQRARIYGLALAMITRLCLLFTLTWIVRLVHPMFTVFGEEISGRDIIMLVGGFFLLVKAIHEIRHMFHVHAEPEHIFRASSYAGILTQIAFMDVIFSLDSVIVAVGMAADYLPVMVLAIVIAILVMMLAARSIGEFVDDHPNVKLLALSFLVLIGIALMLEGVDIHVDKAYLYTAIAFTVIVEFVNMRFKGSRIRTIALGVAALIGLKFTLGLVGIEFENEYLYVAIGFSFFVEVLNARLNRYVSASST